MRTPDLSALESAYQQASLGSGYPSYMLIWCSYCQCVHRATLKSNDICDPLAKEIMEVMACRNS